MYAMPCDSITVRNARVILCYRPADRGFNRYVTLDRNIKPFHQHFALYRIDGELCLFGVTVVDNLVRDLIAPVGDYFTIAKLWEQKYHRRVVFCKAWTMENATKGALDDVVASVLEQHVCESSV